MIDHLDILVTDLARSRLFYMPALAPLGLIIVKETAEGFGFGPPGSHSGLWLRLGTPQRLHFAFIAQDRATVAAFHAAALKAGGRDNGGPGLRPQYHGDYFGAFVLDPDGYNIEAVCHRPE